MPRLPDLTLDTLHLKLLPKLASFRAFASRPTRHRGDWNGGMIE